MYTVLYSQGCTNLLLCFNTKSLPRNITTSHTVSTGTTTLRRGRNYIGIVESQEAAVAMRRKIGEMASENTAVELDSDEE